LRATGEDEDKPDLKKIFWEGKNRKREKELQKKIGSGESGENHHLRAISGRRLRA